MTTLQPNRPVRNGVRPSAFNYALAGVAILFKYLLLTVGVTIAVVVSPFFVLVVGLTWCAMSIIQARRIVSTSAGEPIPPQHGLMCLARLLLLTVPVFPVLRSLRKRPQTGWWSEPCPAGCAEEHNLPTLWRGTP